MFQRVYLVYVIIRLLIKREVVVVVVVSGDDDAVDALLNVVRGPVAVFEAPGPTDCSGPHLTSDEKTSLF